jgi:FkbM family methyltransferase
MFLKRIKRYIRRLKDTRSGKSWVNMQNVLNFLRGNPMRYRYQDGLYFAADRDGGIWFATPKRSVFLNGGVQRRVEGLARAYRLADIRFDDGDVVVDVGANIGEIGLWLRTHTLAVRYIAFEPSPREYSCLTRNAGAAETHNLGLWKETGQLKFYFNSEEADSSFIEPSRFDQCRDVPCCRLDEIVSGVPVKLLKVDAEGAEPEVLEGARDLLQYCEYVVVDAGPERGPDQAVTAPNVINYMVQRGFDVVHINTVRLVVAFQNRNGYARR